MIEDVCSPAWAAHVWSDFLDIEHRRSVGALMAPIEQAIAILCSIWEDGLVAIGGGERAAVQLDRMGARRPDIDRLAWSLLAISEERGEPHPHVPGRFGTIHAVMLSYIANEAWAEWRRLSEAKVIVEKQKKGAEKAPSELEPTKSSKKPSEARVQEILSAIRRAGIPLQGKNIQYALGMEKPGNLRKYLKWMVDNKLLRRVKELNKSGYDLPEPFTPEVESRDMQG